MGSDEASAIERLVGSKPRYKRVSEGLSKLFTLCNDVAMLTGPPPPPKASVCDNVSSRTPELLLKYDE